VHTYRRHERAEERGRGEVGTSALAADEIRLEEHLGGSIGLSAELPEEGESGTERGGRERDALTSILEPSGSS
jgi:hypothetical protein